MLRISTAPRADWAKTVESQGLLFHSIDGEPYWDESAYYLFESKEIDAIEAATQRLDAMCLEAVEHVVADKRLADIGIPDPFHDFVEKSWERDEHTIYGRFDLSYDGKSPPKMLEYNADTPTSLLEAAVIQWFWSRDVLKSLDSVDRPQFDQFNSLHERLIEAWGRVKSEMGERVMFSGMKESLEDVMTVAYLRDVATQAGIKNAFLGVEEIGWNQGRRVFTDLREWPIEILFKLYPWEWMLREKFGQYLTTAPTRWLEPPWKMILSNKAILPILYELFPDSPYLLKASFEPIGGSYVVKPIQAREGANVAIVVDGATIAESDGPYGNDPVIYQDYHPLPEFDGRRAVIGSWMVNGFACGIGIREDFGPITGNTSRFLPHLFRKSSHVTPPSLVAGSSGPGGVTSPLWDKWIDR